MQTVENELRRLREAAGISQRQVAMFLGISNTSVAKWERAPVTEERLRQYQRALGFLGRRSA